MVRHGLSEKGTQSGGDLFSGVPPTSGSHQVEGLCGVEMAKW